VIEVRLHGALWKRAAEKRADEWRRALAEINATNAARLVAPVEDPSLEFVRPPDGSFRVRVYASGYELVEEHVLDPARVQELFDDYGATIRQLVHVDREAPVRGFEAIDYAKRVIHDEAAAFLRESLQSVVLLDLADARRLFTLVFLIGTDLPEELVRYHRRHV
jgi:hypothetical protein